MALWSARKRASIYSQPHSSDLSGPPSNAASVKKSPCYCKHASYSSSTASDTPHNTPNPLSTETTLTQNVQPHRPSLSQPRPSQRPSTNNAQRTMDQSLTSTPPSARARDEHSPSQSRLPHSPSTPFFSKRQPPSATTSPSTPNLRPDLRRKKSIIDKFKGGLKSFFGKDKAPPVPKISAPYAFEHTASMSTHRFMAGPEYRHSVVPGMANLSIDSSTKGGSPSPPPIYQFDGDADDKDEGPKSIEDNRSEDEHSPSPTWLEQLDSEVAYEYANMTPAEREARRLGLELDFEPVRRMQAESPSSDRIVREYADLSPSFYASRLANPIYNGKTITTTAKPRTPVPPAPESIGQWRCCKCNHAQDLYHHDKGEHLVSILNCICPHRSCENCHLTGYIKLYKPVQEPIPVQLDDSKVKFGVFCGTCGLSWRAQTVKNGVLDKISAVPKEMVKLGVKGSRSMHNLRDGESGGLTKSIHNLRALSNEMEKEHGKQANSVMVYFSGITCTCGNVLDANSLCFQIVEAATTVKKEEVEQEHVVVKKDPTFTATSEDRAKGIGKSTLTLDVRGRGRIRHANPLMSNPA